MPLPEQTCSSLDLVRPWADAFAWTNTNFVGLCPTFNRYLCLNKHILRWTLSDLEEIPSPKQTHYSLDFVRPWQIPLPEQICLRWILSDKVPFPKQTHSSLDCVRPSADTWLHWNKIEFICIFYEFGGIFLNWIEFDGIKSNLIAFWWIRWNSLDLNWL